MSAKKFIVELDQQERERLNALISKGKAPAKERRLHNFGRCDEWNLCLTARTVVRANQERE